MRYLFHRYLTIKNMALLAMDTYVLVGVTLFAVWLRHDMPPAITLMPDQYLFAIVLIVLVHVGSLYYHDLYSLKRHPDIKRVYVAVIQSVAVSSALLFGLYYLLPGLAVGRGIFLINMVLLPHVLTMNRMLYRWVDRRDTLLNRVVVMGEPSRVQEVWSQLEAAPDYVPIGRVYTGMDEEEGPHPPPLGDPMELVDIVHRARATGLLVTMRERRGRLPLQDLLYLKIAGIQIDTPASFFERVTGRVPVTELNPSSLVFSEGFRRINLYKRAKFLPDVIMASAMLAVLLPALILIGLAIRLDSKGPALYRQTRVGQAGKLFSIIKFRTMRQDAEQEGARFAEQEDPRVTRVGKFLRKTRIDEFPQLINIVKGEMSFVGPRPERPEFVEELQEKIPYYYLRTVIRPGLTGWAQVRYPYGASIREHREKLEHDLYYIKNMSLTLDTLIFLETIRVVLFGRGSR